jgi:hypothetical protein
MLADLPEIVIQFLFIKLRRRLLELKERDVDKRERNQQRE